jgi:two-component system response regulator AlgR
VARNAIRALVRHHDQIDGDGWAVRLAGVDEVLMVSRRQLAAVREALGES